MPSTLTVCTEPAAEPRGTAVLELSGELDGSATTVLLPAYTRVADINDPAQVLLDVSHVDYINSTGIALLVSVLSQARAQRRTVSVWGLTEHYRQIFRITRLSDYIDVLDDRPAALSGN